MSAKLVSTCFMTVRHFIWKLQH